MMPIFFFDEQKFIPWRSTKHRGRFLLFEQNVCPVQFCDLKFSNRRIQSSVWNEIENFTGTKIQSYEQHGSIFPVSVHVSETFGDIKFSFARAQTTLEVLLSFVDNFKQKNWGVLLFEHQAKASIPVHFKQKMGAILLRGNSSIIPVRTIYLCAHLYTYKPAKCSLFCVRNFKYRQKRWQSWSRTKYFTWMQQMVLARQVTSF